MFNLDPAVDRVDSATISSAPSVLASIPPHPPSAPSVGPEHLSSLDLEPTLSLPTAGSRFKAQNLSVSYPVRGGFWGGIVGELPVLRNIDMELSTGEVLAVVGESGCGKSTLAQALVGIRPIKSGEIEGLGKAQMVFQDPNGSLNPRQTIREILTGPQLIRGISRKDAEQKALESLELVGLAKSDMDSYPHAFSGGQRQRIAIARALALQSEILICDEPTSALDVSVQAQILQLLGDLRSRLGISILLITHDIGVVQALADRVVVMYLGQIVESLPIQDLVNAQHPYTQALLASVPKFSKTEIPILIEGEIPSLQNLPKGCVFASRCPKFQEACAMKPVEGKFIKNNHFCRCILIEN